MDTEIVKGTEIGAAVRGTGHAERGGGIGKENIGATKKDRLADITKKRGNIGALVKTTSTALVDATEKMAPHPLAGVVDDANGREAQIGAHRRLKDAQHSRNGSEKPLAGTYTHLVMSNIRQCKRSRLVSLVYTCYVV